MKFDDGVEFKTEGELRLERRHDGIYVVGDGLLCPVESVQEGREFIKQIEEAKKEKK